MAIKPARSGSVQDDYVLLEQLGQHAGKVFRAQHVREQRAVVVRIWRAPDLAARDRFLESAQLASSVRHPVLPAVEAFGCHGDSTCYIVSECARGESLDRWADRVGIPPVASAIELFQRVCVGLNAAHRNGLTHEALNPRNLFVTQGESDPLLALEPCVLDLGVPSFVRAFPPPLRAAQFMAPEQLGAIMARGERMLPAADVRMNVYSCGAVLHYLCTGGAPFGGRTLDEFVRAQMAGHLLPPSRINPQIPPALDGVIMCALARDPNERYASMTEFGHALERVRTGTGASGVRPRVAPANPAFEIGPFDERPTSEAPRLAMKTPLRPPPPASDAAAASPNEDPQRRTPVGLFSSAPPAPGAPQQTSPALAVAPRSLPPAIEDVDAGQRSARPPMLDIKDELPRRPRRMPPRTERRVAALVTLLAALGLAWSLAHVGTTLHEQDAQPLDPAQHAIASDRDRIAPVAPLPPTRPTPNVEANAAPAIAEPAQGVAGAALDSAAQQREARLRARRPLRELAPAPSARARVEQSAQAVDDAAEASGAAQPSASPAQSARDTASDAVAATPTPPPTLPTQALATTEHAAPAAIHAAPSRAATEDKAAVVRSVAPLAAHASTSDLVVHGSLATSVVRRAIERMRPQFEECYGHAATRAGRNGFGASSIAIEIDEHGRARSPHAHGASLPGLDACLAQVAERLVADRAPDTGRVQATVKVAFTP